MNCYENIYRGDYYGQLSLSGIYQIDFDGGSGFYVGSAANFSERWSLHRHELRKGCHSNVMLQRAWLKYGQGSIRFKILEIVKNKSDLVVREQHWIDTLNPVYNINPMASSRLGTKHSDATKAKISCVHKGRVKSAETIAQWKETMRKRGHWDAGKKSEKWYAKVIGHVKSEETRKILSDKRKGMKFTAEWVENLKKAHAKNPRNLIRHESGRFLTKAEQLSRSQ